MAIGAISGEKDDVLGVDWQSVVKQVGTSQVKMSVGANALDNRQLINIKNISSVDIYIGPSGVTISGATRGDSIGPEETITLSLGAGVDVYAISGTASNDVLIWEFS